MDIHEQVRTVVVTGSPDTADVPGFADRLAELAGDSAGDVVIDVSRCGAFCSAGVQAVLAFARVAKPAGRRVRLVTGEDLITRVVWASHAGELLELHETLRSAYHAVATGSPVAEHG
ncbi:STAS domain-containing protein [Amycolatopsis jiangsuensis]|uniref:Anti-anti-sigma regulatory factor n=1 Tax=Amycolatopsis jiangsuensis TaxID=1181879 RepID=A0A840J6T7_9PSEU|nr:STAS domain-containing protein [Amycolatopsis jiangsuensis]MBB4689114.1 anti-anti-sigma regulatory factor [Amycolatopsis jiangsuensis]